MVRAQRSEPRFASSTEGLGIDSEGGAAPSCLLMKMANTKVLACYCVISVSKNKINPIT
ncbi:hypothetical protein [Entomobacter blattae]|uniref:Uncharacterized protein n=1 Tax=Entomobacter blattae TaxID=2762277 RepID=A0A7H1NRL7_9PROT|nr:hypothetical protein [Entomobacter blattae]QNT78427.1 hypothetical protein JGUZn3_12010 [Entomobacter blattae]